jgi:hypothetical protein
MGGIWGTIIKRLTLIDVFKVAMVFAVAFAGVFGGLFAIVAAIVWCKRSQRRPSPSSSSTAGPVEPTSGQ